MLGTVHHFKYVKEHDVSEAESASVIRCEWKQENFTRFCVSMDP
jgi:hypothetical protein